MENERILTEKSRAFRFGIAYAGETQQIASRYTKSKASNWIRYSSWKKNRGTGLLANRERHYEAHR